ncbi:MAG: Type II/IV secretion system secretin RcpA/CpaC, associated with Flp pilus assembly [Nitrospira sp.]|nr:MAG: Type II/IV secretion system secretin RcpA/CpaC, associated with Flp pilus assembly [Nitrospira sp.]
MNIMAKIGDTRWMVAILVAGSVMVSGMQARVALAEGIAPVTIGSSQVQRLELTVGKSKVLEVPVPLKRASLANPDIADTVILSPTQIYVTGKTVGVTNLTLWQDADKISSIIDVVIMPDLSRIKEDLHLLFPNERGIAVAATHDRLTLSGVVSNAAALPKVLDMAESYAPKRVVNMLGVGGVQQVMLEVRVAEMDRELIRRLGINLAAVASNAFGVTALNNLTSLIGPGVVSSAPTLGQDVTSTINSVANFNTGSISWTGYIDALKQQNVVKVLAKPTLVAINGQEAAFLAGGEFPIPVPQAFGVVTIQFKKFGVGLTFTPNVLANDHIGISVAPEVSELDFTNALRLQGFTIPAITTRRASTVIELADGQSFAIGGLLRDNLRESVSKFPVLGEIPILGALFRSSSFQKNETELLIIVTPHLVKPMDVATQSLPTDYYVEPNDFEFYLLGLAEKGGFGGSRDLRSPVTDVEKPRTLGSVKRFDGGFGHIVP